MSRRKPGLPPVKVGTVAIPRYQLADGRVMIAFPTANKKRQLRTFADPAEARAEAERIARELHNGGQEALIFGSADRADFSQAKRDVSGFGVPVHVATSEWSHAKRQLGTSRHTLAEAVAAGLAVLNRVPHPVPDVAAELLKSLAPKDLNGRYRRGLESTLQRFGEKFPGDIRALEAKDIEAFLASCGEISARRRDNILSEIRYLFKFARTAELPARRDQRGDESCRRSTSTALRSAFSRSWKCG